MTSEDCILDIHICGACRSEFSDIYKFIQHKKECYLSAARNQGHVSELANLAGQFIQHLHSSEALQLHLAGPEFQNETYPCASAQSGDSLENTDISAAPSIQISLSSVLPSSEYSLPDCAKKDSSHFSHALKSAAVFEHKSLDVAASYSYSWPADSDIQEETVSASVGNNVNDNELLLESEVVPHRTESVKAENVVDESRNHVEISADNIAVYVMSPKSFASSVRTDHKFAHDAETKSLSGFSAGSLWSDGHSQADQCNHIPDVFNSAAACASVGSKKSYMNFDHDEQQNDLMFICQDNVGPNLLKSGTSSAFYDNSELTFASNNSTPCPEDLEVGQISAAMFGKKNQQDGFKFILNVSTGQAVTTGTGSMPDAVKTSFLDATSVVSQADACKMFNGDLDSIHGYIRENTASAPIIKVKTESSISSKRRISIEKRERLQGISDDLLSSSVRVTPSCSVRGQSVESHRQVKNQVSTGNIVTTQVTRQSAELPSVTNPCLVSGYKAVFTSPSSGGHRLTPTHVDLSESCSVQDVSSLKRQFFARGPSGFVSKSVEYKNISALMQIQGKQPQAELPHTASGKQPQAEMPHTASGKQPQAEMPHTASGKQPQAEMPHTASGLFTPEKKRERRINFQTNGSAHSEDSEKFRCTSGQNVVLPALHKNNKNVTEASMKSLDRNNIKMLPAAISSVSTPVLSITKAKTPVSINKAEEDETNADGSLQLGLTNESTHRHKDNGPIPVVNNLDEVQICTGDTPSIDPQDVTESDRKPEPSLLSQNDDSYESLLTSCVNNNPSIVMIYKNVDGSVIMVPKMLYTNAHQMGSNTAGASNIELSLGKEHPKKSHNQQQPAELEASFSAVDSREDSSHCYYLHNAGIENQSTEASNLDYSISLTSSLGFPISNQAVSIIPNSATSHIQRTDMPQKSPVCSSTLNAPVNPEKEKFIIKPKTTEGSSKSPAASLTQITKSVKRTSQTPQEKELLVCDVTEQSEDKKSRTFTCKFDKCRYTTSLYKDFQRHYRRHTGEKPYQCPDCGKTFNRSDKLKIHQRRHTGLKPFQCQMCDYAAIEGGSLKKHMRIHTDERPFKCQICSYASRNSSQLIVHLRTHTGDSPFHCTKCPAKFKINSDLKRHMRVHTGEKPFQCDKCEYKSSNKGNLKTHMKINHLEENEIHCPACQFVTSSRKRFREHERVHNVLVVKCTQCDYTCANFGQLRSHMIIHNSVKPYRCKFCSYSSRQSGNLKKHVQNMHLHKLRARSKNPAVEMNGGLKLPGTRRENVLLPISERSSLHRRRSTAGCRKLHSCQECGTSFVREDSLRCHMKQHSSHMGESTIGKEADGHHQCETTECGFQCSHTTSTATAICGIQQIVAAASKIYEENYGAIRTTDQHPAARTKLFTSQDSSLSSLSIDHSITNNQPHTCSHVSSPASTDLMIKRKRRATGLPQLPWERGSYTASVSSTYDPPSDLCDGPASLSSHTKTNAGNVRESNSQQNQSKGFHHNLVFTEDPSKHHNLVFTEDSSSHLSHQPADQQCSPDLMKVRKIEKSFLSPSQMTSSSELTHPSQLPPNADFVRTQSAASLRKPTVGSVQCMVSSDSSDTAPAVLLTHQDANIGTKDSLQVVPQFRSSQLAPAASQGTQTLQPLPVNTMHIQLQPTAQIQIVMPGTTISKSAQLVSTQGNSGVPRQILLQVQGSSEGSQVFTIPVASLNALPTTGQMLAHTVNHLTLQQNGLVNSKVSNTRESQPADTHILGQPTLQLSESIRNIVTSHLSSVPGSAQEVSSVIDDSQIMISSQGQLI